MKPIKMNLMHAWKFRRPIIFLLFVALLLLLVGVVQAQVVGYDLTWWTVDGGGASSAGGDYDLSGTIGQPDAAVWTGGSYSLSGGFWSGRETTLWYTVYLPLVAHD